MRLDKFLVQTNTCSRSQAKKYVKAGKVTINGQVVTKSDIKIDEYQDNICIDEKTIKYNKYEYYMLNKPAGVVSATIDSHDTTVVSLIDSNTKGLFPVGRLDKDTEGLLLITNDGELAHNLLSPKKHVDKKYYARVRGNVSKHTIDLFAQGIRISDDFTAMPARLEIIKAGEISEVYVTIREGKFHQVKRMFLAVSMEVLYLKRISMKNLVLDKTLNPGAYRPLTIEELNDLKTDPHSIC